MGERLRKEFKNTQLARDFDDLVPGVVGGKLHAIYAQGLWQAIEPLAHQFRRSVW